MKEVFPAISCGTSETLYDPMTSPKEFPRPQRDVWNNRGVRHFSPVTDFGGRSKDGVLCKHDYDGPPIFTPPSLAVESLECGKLTSAKVSACLATMVYVPIQDHHTSILHYCGDSLLSLTRTVREFAGGNSFRIFLNMNMLRSPFKGVGRPSF